MNPSNATFVNRLRLDFNINVNLSDVIFTKTNIDLYNINEQRVNSFGERLCLLYLADFTIFNIKFSLKLLTFNYENSNEVLKLDLNVLDKWIEKELASCRNFLQRNRNLNLTFSTLIEFAKYVEARRLICEIVFMKDPQIILNKDEQGGVRIKCVDFLSNMYFGTCWKIIWNLKDFSIIDNIEFYYTNFDNGDSIKELMQSLTHPSLNFHTKLKLWKSLINTIKNHAMTLRTVMISKRPKPSDVLVISDTEDDEVSSTSSHAAKKRRIEGCTPSIVYTIPD